MASIPLDITEAGGGLELAVAELDVCGTNDAGIEVDGVAHVGVRGGRCVVAHDEVVARLVLHLRPGNGAGELEDAPVGHAADDAAIAEDDLAGGEGDSMVGKC